MNSTVELAIERNDDDLGALNKIAIWDAYKTVYRHLKELGIGFEFDPVLVMKKWEQKGKPSPYEVTAATQVVNKISVSDEEQKKGIAWVEQQKTFLLTIHPHKVCVREGEPILVNVYNERNHSVGGVMSDFWQD